MRMEQAGLIDHWWREQSPTDPTPCLSNNIKKKKTPKNKEEKAADDRKRLTLKDLSGAFFLLIAGYILSSLVFIIERSIGRMLKDYRENQIDPLQDDDDKNKPPVADPLRKVIADLPTTSGDFKVSNEEIGDEITIDPRIKPAADSLPGVVPDISTTNNQEMDISPKRNEEVINKKVSKPAQSVNEGTNKVKMNEGVAVDPKTEPTVADPPALEEQIILADLNEMIKEIDDILKSDEEMVTETKPKPTAEENELIDKTIADLDKIKET